MIKYLIALLLITSPCLAGMGIGGFPQPGPGFVEGSSEPSYLDNFNRSDGALGSNWAQAGSWPMPEITSNQIKGASAANQFARYVGASLSANQKSSIVVTATSDSVAPCVRVQDGANSGYCAKLIGNPSYFSIIKIADGVESSIGLVWDTFSNGDILGIKASGSTITAIKNGVDYTEASVTDTTYSDGYTGIWCWGATPTGDDFSTGSL